MQIALLPLDERPVNVQLPRQVAAAAGAELLLPPASAMPVMRRPGSADDLVQWVRTTAPRVDAFVVSLDLLAHGGLIPSRLGATAAGPALSRLEVLREVRRARPELPILGFSVVMRASNSYVATEEPEYWSSVGREVHLLGAQLHEQYLAKSTGEPLLPAFAEVPEDHRRDFVARRIRNHQVNLEALRLLSDEVLDSLLLTVDDTAPRSYGSLEQTWLRHWAEALGGSRRPQLYAGADEVGAMLVSRAAATLAARKVRFRVHCAEEDGLSRIPKYENAILSDSIAGQLEAAGALRVDVDPDVELIVHAPSPDQGDWCAPTPPVSTDRAIIESVVDVIGRLTASDVPVAIADLRFSNGGDPWLLAGILERDPIPQPAVYGGWNTAGNALGGVIATAQASVMGGWTAASRAALRTRLFDDYAYQTTIRRALMEKVASGAGTLLAEDVARAVLSDIETGMNGYRDRIGALTGGGMGEPVRVALPWRRLFEVRLDG